MVKHSDQAGFTLIELVVAMALFSFMLLVITSGFINVVRIYRSGLASRATQHSSRFGVEEIVRAGRTAYDVNIRVDLPASPPINNFDVLCLSQPGAVRRFYVTDNAQRFLVTDSKPCGDPLNPSAQRITAEDVRVSYFHVSATSGSPKTVDIRLGIASTGTDTSLIADGTACDVGSGASEFCSVSGIETTVSLRGQQP